MLYILLAAGITLADQLFKRWIVNTVPLGGYRTFIPGVLGLTHIRNSGMAFSLLARHTWLLALVSAAVSLALIWMLLRGKFPRWEKLCLALILGGAVGNFIDRVFLGYVIDMFSTEFVKFAVFNLADSFIDVGAAAFCVLYIIRTVREDREKKSKETEAQSVDNHSDSR